MNRKIAADTPNIMDLSPTILKLLGSRCRRTSTANL